MSSQIELGCCDIKPTVITTQKIQDKKTCVFVFLKHRTDEPLFASKRDKIPPSLESSSTSQKAHLIYVCPLCGTKHLSRKGLQEGHFTRAVCSRPIHATVAGLSHPDEIAGLGADNEGLSRSEVKLALVYFPEDGSSFYFWASGFIWEPMKCGQSH